MYYVVYCPSSEPPHSVARYLDFKLARREITGDEMWRGCPKVDPDFEFPHILAAFKSKRDAMKYARKWDSIAQAAYGYLFCEGDSPAVLVAHWTELEDEVRVECGFEALPGGKLLDGYIEEGFVSLESYEQKFSR